VSALFAEAGLETVRTERAYMSKIVTLAGRDVLSRSLDTAATARTGYRPKIKCNESRN